MSARHHTVRTHDYLVTEQGEWIDMPTASIAPVPVAAPVQSHGPWRISVIVPALNEEKLIERTLSCFPSDLRRRLDIELIVSDGGSKDQTVSIARPLCDLVAEHTASRRQTIAEGRNRGADLATGDLLVFLNADTVPRDAEMFILGLRDVAAMMAGGGRTAAIACPVQVAPSERGLSDRLFHAFFNRYVRVLNALGVGMGRGECQIVRRDVFQRVGGYGEMVVAGEDFDLYKRVARHGRIGHRDDLCVYESPRRFRRYGYLRILLQWTLNGLAVALLHRSISTEWEEVR